jgi:hypothetical protein
MEIVPKQRRVIVRTSAGIRDTLIDEMERLINGESDAKTASAMARLAGELVKSVEMELKVQEYKDKLPVAKPAQEGRALPPLSLGS